MTKDVSGLYRLVDGTQADPKDCDVLDGELCGPNGVPVALKEDGTPQTLGDETADNKKLEEDAKVSAEQAEAIGEESGEAEPVEARKTRPAPKAKTR